MLKVLDGLFVELVSISGFGEEFNVDFGLGVLYDGTEVSVGRVIFFCAPGDLR